MINAVNSVSTGLVQHLGSDNALKNLSEGKPMQAIEAAPRFDRVELSGEALSQTTRVGAPIQMTLEKPRSWSIATQTLESRMNHVENSIKKADSLGLSFDERLTFLREEGMNWTQSIRQNDPEMFVAWLKMNQDNIASGRSDLASLPSDFTIKDYHAYVKEPFVAFV